MNNKEKQIDKSIIGLLVIFIILAILYGVPFTRWTVLSFQTWTSVSWITLTLNQLTFAGFILTGKSLWDTRYKN